MHKPPQPPIPSRDTLSSSLTATCRNTSRRFLVVRYNTLHLDELPWPPLSHQNEMPLGQGLLLHEDNILYFTIKET